MRRWEYITESVVPNERAFDDAYSAKPYGTLEPRQYSDAFLQAHLTARGAVGWELFHMVRSLAAFEYVVLTFRRETPNDRDEHR